MKRMPAESSFDLVSKINHQEVDNAVNQTAKEIGTRFDFRGVGASIAWSGKEYRLNVGLKEGISGDNAKKISKIIRDEGPKGVRAQVQGDELRVFSKKKDELQEVIALLKANEFDLALQFVNYR